MSWDEKDDNRTYAVVVNHEEQYSIWPIDRVNPNGWKNEGKSGSKEDCLAHIKKIWTDMRPLSLRKYMEESKGSRSSSQKKKADQKEIIQDNPKDPRDNFVEFLSEGKHPVEIYVKPEKRIEFFREAIDHGYINIKFTDTRGGTTLGFRRSRVML